MNPIPDVARPASCPPHSRRLILRGRLACGGAVAGLFAGSILGAVSGALFDAGPFGVDDVIVGPVVLALVGAIWGFLLTPEPISDEHNSFAESRPTVD